MSKRNEPNRTKDTPAFLRMSEEDKAKLYALSEHYGISKADVVTMLVREKIRKEGIDVRPLKHYLP